MNGESNTQPLLRSGVAPLDERLGGLTPGRPYLLTGHPGSGKTSLCLGFVGAALSEGKSAAILTQDDAKDLLAQAADAGVDLPRAAATGRFAMVRYQRDFAARLDRAASTDLLVNELVRLMGPGAPDRVVVDSVAPFLDAGSASGIGIAAVTRVLDRLRATALITYPGDVRDHYDRRLDPLVRRCAAVLHLSSYGEGVGRLDVVKARSRLWSDAPAFFSVRPGQGVVALDDVEASGGAVAAARFRRHVVLLPGVDGLPDDLLAAIRGAFSVSVRIDATPAVMEGLPPDAGAVLLAARWDAFDAAATFLRGLRYSGNRTPAILVARGDARSSDRARALLTGFEDVVGDAVAPAEFIARVTAVVRRGRSTPVPIVIADQAPPLAPSSDISAGVLDEVRFRVAVESAANGSGSQVFSVTFLSPEEGELDALIALVVRTARVSSGDVVGVVGDRVVVYLPGTRCTDATPFARRVAGEWRRAGHRELRVVQLAFPADRDRLRADLRLPALTVHTPLAQ